MAIVAVDTNVLVRFLTKDDQNQYLQSRKLFAQTDIFIPDTVVLETEWVLRFAYEYTRVQICQSLRNLFGLSNVKLSDPALIFQAIAWHESGLDFADALHLAKSQQYSVLCTFDKGFIKGGNGLTSCSIEKP